MASKQTAKRIEILRNTFASGALVQQGEVLDIGEGKDISEADAAALVRLGKASEADDKRRKRIKGDKGDKPAAEPQGE